ncbi:MAG: elongation factor Ts [Bacteroidales bacterium]|nr:elongation factor Ts [Bacteroidales bacterium]
MEIKAADVAKLRKMTGAGMMDCKNALVESKGDFERAQEIIREKGKLVAAKRADRDTTEGAVVALLNDDKTQGVVVCLGCETDFVSKNPEFQELAMGIARTALEHMPDSLEELMALPYEDATVEEAVTRQTGKSGEKHAVPYYNKLEAPYLGSYIHMNNKLATIVGFDKPIAEEAAKEIAMQITAMAPISVNRDSCSQEVIDREMNIYREQIRQEGKPENLVEKIAMGKLNRFFKESTLEDQVFVKDGKISVKEYLKTVDPQVKVIDFRRYSLND